MGAGASKPAGVPLLQEFVAEFKSQLAPQHRQLLEKLETALEQLGRVVDVELILDALEKAKSLQEDTTAALVGTSELKVGPVEQLSEIHELLKQYIRRRCSEDVKPAKVGYLAPLLTFAVSAGTLDVFTLNYDMCLV